MGCSVCRRNARPANADAQAIAIFAVAKFDRGTMQLGNPGNDGQPQAATAFAALIEAA